jgi:hypothetical protein
MDNGGEGVVVRPFTHLHIVPSLRINGGIPPYIYDVRGVSRDKFTLQCMNVEVRLSPAAPPPTPLPPAREGKS